MKCRQEMWVWSLDWEVPLEEEIATHSSILPGKSHEQRSLAGFSPGVKKSQTQLGNRAHTYMSMHVGMMVFYFMLITQ